MASSTSHEHMGRPQTPLSPPPSPPSTRKRHKRRTDSFEKLANTPLPSPPSSPTQGPLADSDEDSLLTKIILTPILFISFILSLSFVNLRSRAHRTHANPNTSFFAYLSPSTWFDLEPYQDPDDSTWSRKAARRHIEPHDALSPQDSDQALIAENKKKKKKKPWHLNKKIRKVAKLEISDALDMRGTVILSMLFVLALVAVLLGLGIKWLVSTLSTSLFAS